MKHDSGPAGEAADHPPAEQTEAGTGADHSASWTEYPTLIVKGFIMGSADIVPGVSGGTMALILGIYTRLIRAIESFDLSFFRNLATLRFREALKGVYWQFLVMLGTGIITAILFFTQVVPLQIYMFTHPELIYGLFFGLIVGSIYILFKAIDRFGWKHAALLAAGMVIGFWVVTLVPTDTPESPLFLFLSGSVAISAMVLPGISGSYILLILRKYDFILTQVGKVGTPQMWEGLLVLLPFVVGAAVGLAFFARLLSWLLDRWYGLTLAVLIGFLIGSLYVIWPYQDRSFEEFVTVDRVVAYDSGLARELRQQPDRQSRPEYRRLGESVTGPEGERQVEVLRVKRKMIRAEPYIPWMTVEGPRTEDFGSGILGLGIGFLLVFGLDYLREQH